MSKPYDFSGVKEKKPNDKNLVELVRENNRLHRQIETLTAERDTALERIAEAEKQEPIAWRAYDRQGWWIVGATRQDALDRCGRGDDRRCEPLYASAIPSTDTSEAIRKAVEEETERCAKICEKVSHECAFEDFAYAWSGADRCVDAIRARSEKENSK